MAETTNLKKLELKPEYSKSKDKVSFIDPSTGGRMEKTFVWIGANPAAAIHDFHLERFFKNTEEEIKAHISRIDKVLKLDKVEGYELRKLKLPKASREDKYKNLNY